MAKRDIQSIIKILSRNSEPLQALCDGVNVKYIGDTVEDFPNMDIELLVSIGIIKKIGDNEEGYLDFSPEARNFFEHAEGKDSIVTDKKVEVFITSLREKIKDYKSTADINDRQIYIKSIKGLLSDAVNSAIDTVRDMADQVDEVYSKLSDLKRKKEKLEFFLNTDKSLMELIKNVIVVITSDMREVRIQENDIFLDSQINYCKIEFQNVSIELQKLLGIIQSYIVNVKERILEVERIHKLKKLNDDGLLIRPDVSNFLELLNSDNSLFYRGAYRRHFIFSLDDIDEDTPIGKALTKYKFKKEEKKKVDVKIYRPLAKIDDKRNDVQEIEDYEQLYNLFSKQKEQDLFSFMLNQTKGDVDKAIETTVLMYGLYPERLNFTSNYTEIYNGDFVIINNKDKK